MHIYYFGLKDPYETADLVQLVLALFRVVNRGLIAIMPEMARGHEAVASCVVGVHVNMPKR